MRIGFFTDTYLPQINGVSTSIKILKNELELLGHEVYIFTTTDPDVDGLVEEGIVRLPSVPFLFFKDRRFAVGGLMYACSVSRNLELDIIHTHTEFGIGLIGKQVAKNLGIPCVHTYHTMYEDYLHYIANGHLLKPSFVRRFSKFFTLNMSGIICPSKRVVDKLNEYKIIVPKFIIPTGIDISQFEPIASEEIETVRKTYGIRDDTVFLLSVSRLSYEKSIQVILKGLPEVIKACPSAHLLIVGDGPYRPELEKQVVRLSLSKYVSFIGEIPNEDISPIYQAADVLVSASDSETQGLTYVEALAAKTKVVAKGNDYLNSLFNDLSLGCTYQENEDFANCLLDYLGLTHPQNEELLEKKLHEISSTVFGQHVETLYETLIEDYAIYDNPQTTSYVGKLSAFKLFKK